MVISVGVLRSQRTDEEGVLNVEGARMVVRAGSMDSLDCPQSESMTYAEIGSARNAMACCSLCLCSLVQLCTVSRSDGGIFDRWGASGSCWICRQTFEAPSVWRVPLLKYKHDHLVHYRTLSGRSPSTWSPLCP